VSCYSEWFSLYMFCISVDLLKRTFIIICNNDLIPLLFPQKTTIWSGRIFCIGCYLGIFTRCLYCVIVFYFTISVYMLRTLQCICMYVDVMVCVCQTEIKKLLTYLLNVTLNVSVVQYVARVKCLMWGCMLERLVFYKYCFNSVVHRSEIDVFICFRLQ